MEQTHKKEKVHCVFRFRSAEIDYDICPKRSTICLVFHWADTDYDICTVQPFGLFILRVFLGLGAFVGVMCWEHNLHPLNAN